MPSIFIHTLGCKLNQLESESFADAFRQAGFTFFNDEDKNSFPSVIIINTCTVTSKADQKARRVIRKALRDYPASYVFVTGCYAQLDEKQLSELEEGERRRLFVLKGMEKDRLLDLPAFFSEGMGVAEAVKSWNENIPLSGDDFKSNAFQFSPESFSEHTRSFLKIQDGCDNHCTYCRIRLARGKCVSLDADIALERLRILEKTHAEAVLTGVNISQYKNAEEGLTELLGHLLDGTEKIAIRLSSLEPEYIDEKFARVVSHNRIRPHFHLSVQSGSRTVLERMGRGYDGETITKAAALLRSVKDDPFLACDIITGFAGETEKEFEDTYNMCKEIGFSWIHVFPYSKRPGTAAFSFPDAVQEKEVTRRVQLFTDLAWKGREEYVKRWLGREVEALVEKSEKDECRGVSENYLKLLINCEGKEKSAPGTVLRCKLTTLSENLQDYDAVATFSGD